MGAKPSSTDGLLRASAVLYMVRACVWAQRPQKPTVKGPSTPFATFATFAGFAARKHPMPSTPHTHILPERQTRIINASEGMRLTVHSGCLWLTRPGDSVDRFLTAGSSIDLHENQVVIQSDRHPGTRTATVSARYALEPLAVASRRASAAIPASDRSSVAKLSWGAPSAWRFMERR